MHAKIRTLFDNLSAKDDNLRLDALTRLLAASDKPVDWFDGCRDELVGKLKDGNSYQRSIGVMLLCNLAKSDVQKTLDPHLDDMLALSKDEKFITRRQTLQHIWKPALENDAWRKKIVRYLEKRFAECAAEKHGNLLRLDIVASLIDVRDNSSDARLGKLLERLVDSETDDKTRKKLFLLLKRQP